MTSLKPHLFRIRRMDIPISDQRYDICSKTTPYSPPDLSVWKIGIRTNSNSSTDPLPTFHCRRPARVFQTKRQPSGSQTAQTATFITRQIYGYSYLTTLLFAGGSDGLFFLGRPGLKGFLHPRADTRIPNQLEDGGRSAAVPFHAKSAMKIRLCKQLH